MIRTIKNWFMHSRHIKAPSLWALVFVLLFCQGCAVSQKHGNNKKQQPIPVATADNPVVEIISMWKAGQGLGLNKELTRGFAGQVLFFTKESPIPALVNSKIRVSLYEDRGTTQAQDKPIHQFDYEPEAWNLYVRETALGPIYSVFIPYPRPGSDRVRCRLQVELFNENNSSVKSKVVDSTLPSKKAISQTTTPRTIARSHAFANSQQLPANSRNTPTQREFEIHDARDSNNPAIKSIRAMNSLPPNR